MTTLHQKLSGIAPMIFFPLLIIFRKRRYVIYACAFLGIMLLSGCYLNFFRANTQPSIDASTMTRLKSENKYFIIHFQNSTNGLEDAFVNGDTLHGKLVPIAPEHLKYLHPDLPKRTRFKKVDKKAVLMEVHLYTNDKINIQDTFYTASLASFDKLDVYELNKSATNANHIISTVGFAYAGLTVLSFIFLLVACNCPQVYVESNGNYDFKSGLYSGAVYSTLERMDYLPLNTISPAAKNISFKIANAKNEEQFINKVELLQVKHQPGKKVLADRHGHFFSYSNLMSPVSTSSRENRDVQNVISKVDESYYSFDNTSNKNGLSDIILTFDKPENVNKAKLVIHARNSYWGGLVHKEFLQLFGDGYERWRERQEKADPKKLEQWQMEQALPVMVYLKTPKGWKFVDYFPLIGNTASRDMIMSINTAEINAEKIELKLETAFRFWDLDFAGMDFRVDKHFETTVLKPDIARSLDGVDQNIVLADNDDQYTHLTGENTISFTYKVPASNTIESSSYFLVSGGYYHNLEPITGKTQIVELMKFRKKGAFSKYSREKYQQAEEMSAVFSSSAAGSSTVKPN
ncbi:MAG: hypothetical protein ABIR81_09365 [Ginsengibacter sp.]